MSPERGRPQAVAAADPIRLDITGPSPRTGTGASGADNVTPPRPVSCHTLPHLPVRDVHNGGGDIAIVAYKMK